jgi:glutathione S-transferase
LLHQAGDYAAFNFQPLPLRHPNALRQSLHLLKKPPPKDDDLAIWHLRGNIALEIMERHLAKKRWLAADAFTIADIALYAYTHVAPEGGFDLSRYRGIQRWLKRIKSRPG